MTGRQHLPSCTFHSLIYSLAAAFCDVIFTMTKRASKNVPYKTETKIIPTSIERYLYNNLNHVNSVVILGATTFDINCSANGAVHRVYQAVLTFKMSHGCTVKACQCNFIKGLKKSMADFYKTHICSVALFADVLQRTAHSVTCDMWHVTCMDSALGEDVATFFMKILTAWRQKFFTDFHFRLFQKWHLLVVIYFVFSHK